MGDARRVVRNTAVLTVGEALGQLANLVFIASFARVYGVVVTGHYSLAMAIGAILGLAVSVGTHGLLTRELAHSPALAARRVGALARWQAAAALGFGALAALMLAGRDGHLVMLAAIGYQLTHRVAGLYFVPFRSAESMTLPVLADVGQRVITLLIGGLLMLAGAAPEVTLLALLLGGFCFAAAGRVALTRRVGPLPRVPGAESLALLRESAPFFGTLALAVLFARGAPLLLGLTRGAEAVGTYAAADRLILTATLVPMMFASAAMPALARVAGTEPERLYPLGSQLLRMLLLIALPVAAAVAAFATDLVALVYGAAFAAGADALRVLAAAVPLQAVELLFAALLSAAGRQVELVRNRLWALGVFGVAGLGLSHACGATGLAAAVVLAAAVMLAGAVWRLARGSHLPVKLAAALAPASAAALALVATWLLREQALWLRVAGFITVLALATAATGALRREDLRFLSSLARRVPPDRAG